MLKVTVLYFVLTLALLGGQGHAATHTISGRVSIKDSSGQPITDLGEAVVFIDEVSPGKAWPVPAERPSMASANKTFTPGVLAVLKGTTVEFPNEDRILHNVFSLSKTKTFDLGLYKRGASKSVTFDTPGVVTVYCNIHEKMIGHILVLANPFFTRTTEDGAFKIENVPPGKYNVISWHRFSDAGKREVIVTEVKGVEVGGAATSQLLFELQEKPRSYKHKNKFGQPYSDKY